MRRFSILIPGVVMLLGACKIEQTPRRFIDRQLPVAEDRAAAEDEIRSRFFLLAQMLERGDPSGAFAALAPAPDMYVVGVDEQGRGIGPEALFALLQRITTEAAGRIALREVQVDVGPRAAAGWVTAVFEVSDEEQPTTHLRFTGVYLLREGAWQLIQAHLSVPAASLTAPRYPPVAEDSLAPE